MKLFELFLLFICKYYLHMEYKRKFRAMPLQTKEKISASLTGRKHSEETKRKISDGQKRAWAKIPYNNLTNTNGNDENENQF